MATTRITITIDSDLLDELRGRVGRGQVSAYVVESIRTQLRKDTILELLDKLDEMYGPLTDKEIAEGEGEWIAMRKRLSQSI